MRTEQSPVKLEPPAALMCYYMLKSEKVIFRNRLNIAGKVKHFRILHLCHI